MDLASPAVSGTSVYANGLKDSNAPILGKIVPRIHTHIYIYIYIYIYRERERERSPNIG